MSVWRGLLGSFSKLPWECMPLFSAWTPTPQTWLFKDWRFQVELRMLLLSAAAASAFLAWSVDMAA